MDEVPMASMPISRNQARPAPICKKSAPRRCAAGAAARTGANVRNSLARSWTGKRVLHQQKPPQPAKRRESPRRFPSSPPTPSRGGLWGRVTNCWATGPEEQMTPQQAKRAGYCIVSRRKPTWAARLDRKDWKEYMASTHPGGMYWVKCLGKDAADHYRRCHSKDVIEVPIAWIKALPNSHSGPVAFLPSNAELTGGASRRPG